MNEMEKRMLYQTEYQARYDGVTERFDRTKAQLEAGGSAITEDGYRNYAKKTAYPAWQNSAVCG